MRRYVSLLGPAALLASCVSPTEAALTPMNIHTPSVIGTVPSLDGGSACLLPALLDGGVSATLPSSVPAQVIFSEVMDVNTLRPGIALYACPCTPGVEPLEVPALLSVVTSTTLPDYAQVTPAPYTVQIQPAANGNPCLPDGGTFGCFSSALYLIQLRTLLADTAGHPLGQECQINFEAL